MKVKIVTQQLEDFASAILMRADAMADTEISLEKALRLFTKLNEFYFWLGICFPTLFSPESKTH